MRLLHHNFRCIFYRTFCFLFSFFFLLVLNISVFLYLLQYVYLYFSKSQPPLRLQKAGRIFSTCFKLINLLRVNHYNSAFHPLYLYRIFQMFLLQEILSYHKDKVLHQKILFRKIIYSFQRCSPFQTTSLQEHQHQLDFLHHPSL